MGIRGHAEGEGGWCTFENVPGWEGLTLAVRAAVVDGTPRAIALRVEPRDDTVPVALTVAMLRLPLVELATLALDATRTGRSVGDHRAAMRRLARRQAVKHDPRAVVTVEQVAQVWLFAYHEGRPPRAAVEETLGIGARTADRYIARARKAGLIPERKRK